jgi:DNA-directed RNA polymerase specialized sigma24 family protein
VLRPRPERLALARFLAGYSGLTREAYELDLRQQANWCRQHQLGLQTLRGPHPLRPKTDYAASLGALLERHRAEMHAVALSMLGWGPDAEDAVQDAMLTALRRPGGLRNPAAAGAWLKAVTRNAARMRLRSTGREIPVAGHADVWPSPEPTPDEILDGVARLGALLAGDADRTAAAAGHARYFTEASSYQQIAAACRVPVGTIRSRLSEARRKLTAALLQSGDHRSR